MRLFLFLILLSPAFAFGQACTEATLAVPDGDASPNTYSCTTLDIGPAGLNRSAEGSVDPIIVTVTGNVTIRGNINFNGGNGFTLTADGTAGPSGGPGAVSGGGGVSGSEGEPQFSINPEDGLAPPRNGVCNDGGGGGGGYSEAGDPGLECDNDPSVSATGGADWGSTVPLTRGGFGGGAGGAHDVATVFNHGSGGGGGGAIHIISTAGTITVNSNVTISAKGGIGGNATSIGGGGGGGSGGVILLDGALGVTVNGILDVRGGSGGVSTGGGEGGAGKSGVYRIVNAGVTTDGTGVTTPTVTNTPVTKFKSDISCGTVAKKNENQQMFFQVMVGFFLVLQAFFLKTAFSSLIRRSSKVF